MSYAEDRSNSQTKSLTSVSNSCMTGNLLRMHTLMNHQWLLWLKEKCHKNSEEIGHMIHIVTQSNLIFALRQRIYRISEKKKKTLKLVYWQSTLIFLTLQMLLLLESFHSKATHTKIINKKRYSREQLSWSSGTQRWHYSGKIECIIVIFNLHLSHELLCLPAQPDCQDMIYSILHNLLMRTNKKVPDHICI